MNKPYRCQCAEDYFQKVAKIDQNPVLSMVVILHETVCWSRRDFGSPGDLENADPILANYSILDVIDHAEIFEKHTDEFKEIYEVCMDFSQLVEKHGLESYYDENREVLPELRAAYVATLPSVKKYIELVKKTFPAPRPWQLISLGLQKFNMSLFPHYENCEYGTQPG